MRTADERALLAHLMGTGPRGRVLRPDLALAAQQRLVLTRGRLTVLYGLDDVRAAAQSPDLRMPRPVIPAGVVPSSPAFLRLFADTLSFTGLERHRFLRQQLVGHFSAAALERRHRVLDRVAASLLPANGRFDLVPVVADRLASRTVSAVIGAADVDWPDLDRLGHAMLAVLGSSFRGAAWAGADPIDDAGFHRVTALLRRLVRGDAPVGSLAAALRASIDADRLTEEDAVGLLVVLYMTGVDTVAAAVGNAALALAEHRPSPADLAGDAGEAFVAEALRLDPPLHYGIRAVERPTVVAGRPVQPGDQIVLCFASAGLDPVRHPDPLGFLPGRRPPLTFGHGVHRCVGGGLALQQTAAVLRLLADRNLEPDLSAVRWRDDPTLHAPSSLPLIARRAVAA